MSGATRARRKISEELTGETINKCGFGSSKVKYVR
jgi:hypothetical protein